MHPHTTRLGQHPLRPTSTLFTGLTAFFSPLCPTATRSLWTLNSGRIATSHSVTDTGCSIHLWFASYGYPDPFVDRLQALDVELVDSLWVDASVAAHRFVDPEPFTFSALARDPRPLTARFSSHPHAHDSPDTTRPAAPFETPRTTSYAHLETPGPAPAAAPRTARQLARGHDLETPLLARSAVQLSATFDAASPSPSPSSPRSSATAESDDAVERELLATTSPAAASDEGLPTARMSDDVDEDDKGMTLSRQHDSSAAVDEYLVLRSGPTINSDDELSFVRVKDEDEDDDGCDNGGPLPPSSAHTDSSRVSVEKQLLHGPLSLPRSHLGDRAGAESLAPAPAPAVAAGSDTQRDAHSFGAALEAFFAAPLDTRTPTRTSTGAGAEPSPPPTYDADALLALLRARDSGSGSGGPKVVELVEHGRDGWVVRRRETGSGG